MAKSKDPARRDNLPENLRNRPFAGLRVRSRPVEPIVPVAPVVRPPATEPPETEAEIFAREMLGVRRLAAAEAARLPSPRAEVEPRPRTDSEAEALAELCDLVNGHTQFDITDTEEYVEGWAIGIDRRLVRNLRAGKFASQAHLDLHRLTREQARGAVDQFLGAAHRRGLRCVILVHGRGLNSRDKTPVLKQWLCNLLARGPWSRLVLAFTSARPCDGGAGALYVLLRRQRTRKQQMRIYDGAKS